MAARAAELRAQILRWTDGPVNLVAHSMGGLDARYLITHLNMAEQVRSLTTVSTPHRGTYLVDWFFQNYNQRVPLFLASRPWGSMATASAIAGRLPAALLMSAAAICPASRTFRTAAMSPPAA